MTRNERIDIIENCLLAIIAVMTIMFLVALILMYHIETVQFNESMAYSKELLEAAEATLRAYYGI